MLDNTQDVCKGARSPIAISDLGFGVSIDTIGNTRQKLAQSIVDCAKDNGQIWQTVCKDKDNNVFTITDTKGKVWYLSNTDSQDKTAIKSPSLTYCQFDLHNLAIVLQGAAKIQTIDDTCNMSIDIATGQYTALSIARLYSYFSYYCSFIYTVLGVSKDRLAKYKPLPSDKLTRLYSLYGKQKQDFDKSSLSIVNFDKQYKDDYSQLPSNDINQYFVLSLNNLWRKSQSLVVTAFGVNLQAKTVIANIALTLALNVKAINSQNVKKGNCNITDLRTRLSVMLTDGLGLTGDLHTNTRHILTAKLNTALANKTIYSIDDIQSLANGQA